MKNSLIILLTTLCFNNYAALEISKELDVKKIKEMAGCYEVVFQSTETFSPKSDYNFYPRYQSKALEWIFVSYEDETRVELQHLLVGSFGVMKHWRQRWDYEANSHLEYQGFSDWAQKQYLKSENSWAQRVYQVDDSPRYECVAPWIHTPERNYWECEANAPLPRREFSKRSDYNILKRKNRHEFTKDGHVHDQDNSKISNKANRPEVLIAMEKTYNTYKKVDDKKCMAAPLWWELHKNFWNDVVSIWDEILYTRSYVKFEFKKDESLLWEKLFKLDEELSNKDYNSEAAKKIIKATIESHLL